METGQVHALGQLKKLHLFSNRISEFRQEQGDPLAIGNLHPPLQVWKGVFGEKMDGNDSS